MTTFQAIIFGIVEGISEFLPISSTGHLILTSRLLGLSQTEFLKSFEITIQFGAILSVILIYWKFLLVDKEVLKRVIAAFIPTGVIGFFLYKLIKKILLGSSQVVLWSLFLGGIFLILFEIYHKQSEQQIGKITDLSYGKAVLIGIFQSIAVIPGVSRSAATIVGGLALGMERQTIVEFSFLLAVPTMLAATGLDLVKNAGSFSMNQLDFLLTGFLISFIVSVVVIKWFLHYVKRHSFLSFGIYRIALALIFWFGFKF